MRDQQQRYHAEDIATVAELIVKGLYPTERVTPNIRALARDYLRLRQQPTGPGDLLQQAEDDLVRLRETIAKVEQLPRYAFDERGYIYGPVDGGDGTFIQHNDLVAALAGYNHDG